MESLSVKYRPKSFEDVVSQDSIVRILKKQIETKDFRNVFLFCGASGCGKTTIARIFANELNNYQGIPIEIDAASNNGVDNIKQIVKSATERSIDSEYKIYIIDECHSLTSQAWQAFLKCIEEPPKYTIFIFCTTDPQKIPETILNRVLRFNFTKISQNKIYDRLIKICNNENFINFEETCDYISRISNGCMRDAITSLDKVSRLDSDININNALSCLGNYSYSNLFKLMNHIIDGNEKDTIFIIEDIYSRGIDLKLFIDNMLDFTLDVVKYLLFNNISLTKIPNNYENEIKNCINFNGAHDYYIYIINKLLEIKNSIKTDTDIKSTIEVMLIAMCRCS